MDKSKFVIFMDNCRIHIAECNTGFKHYVEFFLNCPYSPFLNPIEEIFGFIKYHFRRLNTDEVDESMIYDNITKCIKLVSRDLIQKFIAHSMTFIPRGILKEPIY